MKFEQQLLSATSDKMGGIRAIQPGAILAELWIAFDYKRFLE
jgi:hypothetical protein